MKEQSVNKSGALFEIVKNVNSSLKYTVEISHNKIIIITKKIEIVPAGAGWSKANVSQKKCVHNKKKKKKTKAKQKKQLPFCVDLRAIRVQ